jgi:hypothetical protein
MGITPQRRSNCAICFNVPISSSRLSTGTPFFRDLIAEIKRGNIKIPQFQRKFVWKEEQAFRLLDSIKNNYPIGSLLIWKTGEKLSVERNIGNFKLPATDDMNPTDYVLDGQQRITVIYSSLGAPDDGDGFSPGYDLNRQLFLSLQQEDGGPHVFPLRWIYNTTKMLNFRTALLASPGGDKFQERLDELVDAVTKYQIPVVTLKDLTIEEVCPIFERINSSGTKLSTYDLMVAATWSKEFDLNEQVEKIAGALSNKKFEKIDRETVLKCVAAVKSNSIRQDQIVKLRGIHKDDMHTLVGRVRQGLLDAVDMLSTEFGIHSWDFLPYEALLIILTYAWANQKPDSAELIVKIRKWFWRAAFAERYRVGGENFVSNDLALMLTFLRSEEAECREFSSPASDPDQWQKLPFRASNSISRALILALAAMHPRNLTTGSLIDTTVALSRYNKKEYHHIYPRSYLKKSKTPGEHNAIANICMLVASENLKISDQDPNIYLPRCIE